MDDSDNAQPAAAASNPAADPVVREVIAPSEPVRIGLRWSPGRRRARRVAIGAVVLVAVAVLELPLLLAGPKPWAIGLIFVVLVALPAAGAVVERMEVADIRRNGPFITVADGEVRLPESLATKHHLPALTALAGMRVAAWRSQQFSGSVPTGLSSLSRREKTYLELVGGDLALVLGSDRYPAMAAHLPTRPPHAGMALAPGVTPIEVLTGDLVRAAEQLAGTEIASADPS